MNMLPWQEEFYRSRPKRIIPGLSFGGASDPQMVNLLVRFAQGNAIEKSEARIVNYEGKKESGDERKA